MKKNIRMIRYMLGIVWKADKKAYLWAAVNFIWLIIPTTFNAMIYKWLIDAITEQKPLYFILGIVVLYALQSLAASLWSDFLYEKVYVKLELNVKKYVNTLLLQKSISLDMTCYDDPEFYDKLTRAYAQANTRAMQVFYQMVRLISNIIYFAVGASVIVLLDPLMIAFAVIVGVILFVLDISFVKVHFKANEEMTFINRMVEYFQALMSSPKTISDIKQYAGFDQLIIEKYRTAADEQCKQTMALADRKQKHTLKTQSLVASTSTFIPYAYLAVQAFRGIVTVADIPAMYNAFNLITNSLSDFSREITNLKESSLYIEQLKEVLEYEPVIETNTGVELETLDTIIFEDVSFCYPYSEVYVLKHINLTIRNGDKLAIVGINGAGKTTLVKLLLRYYDPTEGRILINGIDLKSYNALSVRRKIATLFQEFQPYSIPIDQLIACSSETNKDKIIEVLKDVGLYDRILRNPKGITGEYSKMFDEDGIVLSGGEMQKLFIARMRYKGGDMYIMDEPSSALDPISEYEINNMILQTAKDSTVIMIAHRLSTTVNADIILMMENGEIIERGSHKDLLAQNGEYATMFNLQAEQYIASAEE